MTFSFCAARSAVQLLKRELSEKGATKASSLRYASLLPSVGYFEVVAGTSIRFCHGSSLVTIAGVIMFV